MKKQTATAMVLIAVGLGCGGATKKTSSTVGSPNATGTTVGANGGGPASPGSGSSAGSSSQPMSGSAGSSSSGKPSSTTTPTTMGGGGASANQAAADAGAMAATDCPTCPISKDCQGLPLEGMKYSPGGSVLPNKCAPFHPTTNNPYAIRCIDAMPGFKTKFPGDQYCILPPPPDLGMQVGLHPQGTTDEYWKAMWAGDFSGYDNPDKIWVLQPGDEVTQNYMTTATNTEAKNYYRTYFRMRTGSHHNIVSMHMSTTPDGWIDNGGGEALPGPFDLTSGTVIGILGGQQRADDGTPSTLEKPPEDEGLYLTFPASPRILFNMHHFNITNGPVLREGWSNIWYETDTKTLASWYMGMEPTEIISLNVPAGQTADLHYSWSIGAETRLLRVFGHRHFWTPNFSTWIERSGSTTPELIYQSYDWFDQPTYRYDSVVKNPPVDPMDKMDGAASGVVMLHPGDKMHFNCHVEFTDARAAQDSHAPSPEKIGALRFANEAYNGEMCIQYGNVAGSSLGLPAVDSSPVPDFAKLVR